MKKYFIHLVISLIFYCYTSAFPQDEVKVRADKIEQILRTQDTRSIFDGKLISFLTDPDSIVREKAVLAYGSIQDTSVIDLLIDRFTEDRNSKVQFAAAFAIGQTAINLNHSSKQKYQNDLIWSRLDKAIPSAQDRMIEEIGKFGTGDALRDLVSRFGSSSSHEHDQAMFISIARFAIRNIVNREAVQYLLTYINLDNEIPWQVVYALQRIGNNTEIRASLDIISNLFKSRNSLVRMNLATLLGKVKDENICIPILQKLAESDNDWRVRVNAIKALSNYKLKGRGDVIDIFRRTFFSGNTNLAITAISTFGTTGLKKNDIDGLLKETYSAIEKIAVNKDGGYMWQLQAEAIIALAKLEGKDALQFISEIENQPEKLQAASLTAMGITGATGISETLFGYLNADHPIIYCAVLDGLLELAKKNRNDSDLAEKIYNVALNALTIEDVAINATAASILGDSLFLRESSVEKLIDALGNLRLPDDLEAIQEIIATLGKLKDVRAINALRSQFEQRDMSVIRAAASALKSITGQDYSSEIPKYFEPLFTDFDFRYLNSLKDTIKVKMETMRGDVIMELYKNYAPFTVMSFLKLATEKGFYRGLSFHRIVPNFVIQGGDPRSDGWGGPGYTLRSEFSPLTFETGMVGMASSGKDTEGSQFFITESPQPHLDGRYTIFGKVISGMDVVNKIQIDDHIFDIKVQ